MPAAAQIPHYVLYGDSPSDVGLHFLHVETISVRSRVHNWEIQPHRHIDLVQLFLITAGGGELRCDETLASFLAPTLILMPPASVHGFRFAGDTNGHVLTVSERFIGEAVGSDADFPARELLAQPSVLAIGPGTVEARQLHDNFATIASEFVDSQSGRVSAIGAHLRLILVSANRLALENRERETLQGEKGAEVAIFRRFRQAIEHSFRAHRSVADYASELGVGDSRLTGICRRIAGRSPLALIHGRVVAEAKRDLLYTSMTVSEIAYALGFQDPGYFSRFFSHQTGEAPAAYRKRQGPGAIEGAGAP